jgi:hypothetical protein
MPTRSREPVVMRRRSSGCFAVVVPEHSAQSLPAHHFTRRAPNFFPGLNQPVAEPLVIMIRVKVEDEFSNAESDRCLRAVSTLESSRRMARIMVGSVESQNWESQRNQRRLHCDEGQVPTGHRASSRLRLRNGAVELLTHA